MSEIADMRPDHFGTQTNSNPNDDSEACYSDSNLNNAGKLVKIVSFRDNELYFDMDNGELVFKNPEVKSCQVATISVLGNDMKASTGLISNLIQNLSISSYPNPASRETGHPESAAVVANAIGIQNANDNFNANVRKVTTEDIIAAYRNYKLEDENNDEMSIVVWSQPYFQSSVIHGKLAIFFLDIIINLPRCGNGSSLVKEQQMKYNKLAGLCLHLSSHGIYIAKDSIQDCNWDDLSRISGEGLRSVPAEHPKQHQNLTILVRNWTCPSIPYGEKGGVKLLERSQSQSSSGQQQNSPNVISAITKCFSQFNCLLLPPSPSDINENQQMERKFYQHFDKFLTRVLDPRYLIPKKIADNPIKASDIPDLIQSYVTANEDDSRYLTVFDIELSGQTKSKMNTNEILKEIGRRTKEELAKRTDSFETEIEDEEATDGVNDNVNNNDEIEIEIKPKPELEPEVSDDTFDSQNYSVFAILSFDETLINHFGNVNLTTTSAVVSTSNVQIESNSLEKMCFDDYQNQYQLESNADAVNTVNSNSRNSFSKFDAGNKKEEESRQGVVDPEDIFRKHRPPPLASIYDQSVHQNKTSEMRARVKNTEMQNDRTGDFFEATFASALSSIGAAKSPKSSKMGMGTPSLLPNSDCGAESEVIQKLDYAVDLGLKYYNYEMTPWVVKTAQTRYDIGLKHRQIKEKVLSAFKVSCQTQNNMDKLSQLQDRSYQILHDQINRSFQNIEMRFGCE